MQHIASLRPKPVALSCSSHTTTASMALCLLHRASRLVCGQEQVPLSRFLGRGRPLSLHLRKNSRTLLLHPRGVFSINRSPPSHAPLTLRVAWWCCSYLSKLTGDPFFHEVAQRASDAVEEARVKLAWGQKGGGEQQVTTTGGLGGARPRVMYIRVGDRNRLRGCGLCVAATSGLQT